MCEKVAGRPGQGEAPPPWVLTALTRPSAVCSPASACCPRHPVLHTAILESGTWQTSSILFLLLESYHNSISLYFHSHISHAINVLYFFSISAVCSPGPGRSFSLCSQFWSLTGNTLSLALIIHQHHTLIQRNNIYKQNKK